MLPGIYVDEQGQLRARGDGNCFYASINAAYAAVHVQPLNFFSTTPIRARFVQWLRDHADDDITPPGGEDVTTLRAHVETSERMTFEEYCAQQARPGVFATRPIVVAASAVLGLPIRVIYVDDRHQSEVVRGPGVATDAGEGLVVRWTAQGNHYDPELGARADQPAEGAAPPAPAVTGEKRRRRIIIDEDEEDDDSLSHEEEERDVGRAAEALSSQSLSDRNDTAPRAKVGTRGKEGGMGSVGLTYPKNKI